MLEGVKASPPECKFSKGTEKVKNIGLKVKIIKNTPNVKSRKPLKNKENRVLGGSRLICLVIRLGFEPKTHSLEGCCSIQLSYRTIVIRMGSHARFGTLLGTIRRLFPECGCKDRKIFYFKNILYDCSFGFACAILDYRVFIACGYSCGRCRCLRS